MTDHHAKRFGSVPLAEPVFCLIFYDVGGISFHPFHAAIHRKKIRIKIQTLSLKYLPEIESLWLAAKVPFSDPGSEVAIVL